MLNLSELRSAVRAEGGVSRRLFLAYGAALSSLPLLGSRAEASTRRVRFDADPFTLGVASGDPTPAGPVLWTRLAPSPARPGWGHPSRADRRPLGNRLRRRHEGRRPSGPPSPLPSSATPSMSRSTASTPTAGTGTASDRETPRAPSAAPAPRPKSCRPERLRFAFASCQHYEYGYFTAYEHMAPEELDLIVHLGDYIYENGGRDSRVRKHAGRRSYRSPTTESATRNTGPTRTSRPCTPAARGS